MPSQPQGNIRRNKTILPDMYRRGHPDAAVSILRARFLKMAYEDPDARRRLLRLFEKPTLILASRDLRVGDEVSNELQHRIEEWAIHCGLGKAPIRDWWIFAVATHELAQHVRGPDASSENTAISFGQSMPVTLPEAPPDLETSRPFPFLAFDPWIDSRQRYRDLRLRAFTEFLDEHIRIVEAVYQKAGFERTPIPRDNTHLMWLVQSQILDKSDEDIANSTNPRVSTDHVRIKLVRLRKLLRLPTRRGRGERRLS